MQNFFHSAHQRHCQPVVRSKRYSLKCIFYIALLTLLSSCGSAPTKDKVSSESITTGIALEDISRLLDEADTQGPEARTLVYLNVTQTLLEAEEYDWARNTLAQLSPNAVPEAQYIRYAVLSSALALAEGDPFRARALLWEDRLINIEKRAAPGELAKLLEMRARILSGLGRFRESIEQRMALHNVLEQGSEASALNQQALWQTLMELPYTDLKLESQIQNDMLARGWYTLAALSKNNQTNLRQQIKAVENWMFNWPEHPASLALPADLQMLKKMAENQPNQVAILLPFSGRFEAAAKAIRDGIMAAYYEASSQTGMVPDLRIYDTANKDINTVYDDAVLQGAELVIGPLEQEKIAELSLRPELPVPTLALNRANQGIGLSYGLFQFGLPLEDEAQQVAEQAWKDGHRRAMVLAPKNSNGDRSVTSFSQRWIELGGEIINDYRYDNQSEYSNLVKSAVKIDESERRKNSIRSIIGKSFEFEPRRRKDVDFIFLYSQASQARQLKPILAFHYAGDIPVYAIKDIYSGSADAKRDRDLNGIRFTTLPWLFEKDLPEKRAIAKYSASPNYQFLYALGVDAYHLHPRLQQLMEIKQSHFYGTTGKLRLDDQNVFRREQIWAKFERGLAVPVSTFSAIKEESSDDG